MFHIATEHGVFGHMLPTFSTKTLPNHHSIATGLYQETHGIIHNHMYDPLFGEHFQDDLHHWWNNYQSTPIYIANQIYDKHHRFSCCSPWIGCHAKYHHAAYQTRYFRRFNRSSCYYEQFEWTINKMMNRDQPANLAMLYIAEPDMTAHRYGPFGTETLKQVKKLDRFVGYMESRFQELNLTINLILLSDHGISQIHPRRTIILNQLLINESLYEAYGSNPVFTIKVLTGYEPYIYRTLLTKSEHWPAFRVYRKCQIPKRFRYADHRRIHDLLIVAEEGWSIYKNQQEWQKESEHRGQHGYDNHSQRMRPIFIARGPDFHKGLHHRRPFHNVDLYPMLLTLLRIPPGQYYHQGNMDNVRCMIKTGLPV